MVFCIVKQNGMEGGGEGKDWSNLGIIGLA
jgi:hypothetical protein